MKENSRTRNAILNIVVGIIAQIGILLLSFIGRSVFVRFLDSEYLGINGLYGNILSVLSLAELGMGSVTQFYLYKPVVEDNKPLIVSLVNFFRKIYLMISLAIFGIGILIIPFLKYIVNSDLSQTDLIVYYLLFLINSVISYFSAHKVALLAANQDTRLQKYVLLITNFGTQILHIIVLSIWHSFVIYVMVTVFSTLVNVILINYIGNKRYPFLKTEDTIKIPESYLKGIKAKIKSTFVYKIGATIINNTDNILISIIVSTAAVGLYSNYSMIVLGVQGFISIITTALISGVGNLSAYGNKKKMKKVFNTMLLLYQLMATFGSICFFFLFDEFIPIWVGEKYLLDRFTVLAISLNFYLTTAISPIWMFREANGLFDKVKYLLLSTAIVNIILSVLFGNLWGTAGVLLATVVARILTQVWYEPKILFKNIFLSNTLSYWGRQIWYFILAFIVFILSNKVNMFLPHGFIGIILRGIAFGIITIIIFTIGNFKRDEFKEIFYLIKR